MSAPVRVTIDGHEVEVPAGTLIIRAAEQVGIEIPRFCEHPLLEPIGACRQCYVEVEGQRKLVTSCTTPVAPGMVVRTQNASEEARTAQVANLEFLLLNHPLDCPICDRGGECPLQDQAMAFGPGESRYTEPKRTYRKPIALSPLVGLDRERCVLCTRCTRFCDQISGDRFLELFERGAAEQVGIAAGEDFRSPFSGNTVQICPVGALTSTSYRFAARPFDLQVGDSVCPHCAAGCSLRVDLRRGEVVRHLARDDMDVNDTWLCDKGRYAFRFPDAADRVTTPLLRERGLEPVSFGEALAAVARATAGRRVAFLVGGRVCDEDAYALAKLARTAYRTNDIDHRRLPGGPAAEASVAARPMETTYADVEAARAILVVGLDAEQELPILHLRLRKAARAGARIAVVHPRRTRLHDVATHTLVAPGGEGTLLAAAAAGRPSGDPVLDAAAAALREAGDAGVVIAGERLDPAAQDLALALARATGARFALASRRANDRGALRSGVHPTLLPGGRAVGGPAAAEVEARWGSLAGLAAGRATRAILEACAAREVDALFLVGIDPLVDLPDGDLARRALENVPFKVVQSLELGELEPFADVFLPAAAFLEKDAHVTDWEGRARRLRPVRGVAGLARPDWQIAAELARALGSDLGFDSLDALREELGALLAPTDAATPAVPAPAAATAPTPPADGVVLFTYPLLVDEGRLARGADELHAALGEPAFLEVGPDDAARLGLADGALARVRTDVGEAELPVRVSRHVAAGAAFVPFNNPGLRANALLSGGMVAAATVVPAGAP
ncbi:MAG: NADH-quinone oxidoreductase subunit G, partial [Actinomycetota bacterium]